MSFIPNYGNVYNTVPATFVPPGWYIVSELTIEYGKYIVNEEDLVVRARGDKDEYPMHYDFQLKTYANNNVYLYENRNMQNRKPKPYNVNKVLKSAIKSQKDLQKAIDKDIKDLHKSRKKKRGSK